MRGVLIFAFMALSLSVAGAKGDIKVVEKSAKKPPVWVGTTQTDYIVTSAIAPDIETAKAQCMDNVRKQIIDAVAQNISSESTSTIDQQSVNSQITGFLDTFSSTTRTQSAPVPYLKGISPSKIEESYWEKRLDKSSSTTTVLYAIKYPFPRVELKELTYQFEKNDKAIWGKYLALADQIDNLESVEQIDRAIVDLNPVIDYLFDNTRKNAAKALQTNYQELYKAITFRTLSNQPGEYRFCMMLNGKLITTSQRMTFDSECATQLSAERQDDGSFLVRYRYDNCRYDRENQVTVRLKLAGRTVPHTFYVTIKKYEVELWAEKIIYFDATERADSVTLTGIGVRMYVKSGLGAPYTIRSMTFEVPGLSAPLFLDGLDLQYSAKESTVNASWKGSVKVLSGQGQFQNMLRGSMEVQLSGDEATKRINFALPMRANW